MRNLVLLLGCFVASCSGDSQKKSELDFKEELSKPLTEISGLMADRKVLWAITDKPKAVVYKLSLHGKVAQEMSVSNAEAIDVESVTADANYVYIGDVGDNDGTRQDRQIIRVAKSGMGNEAHATIAGELITFHFSDEQLAEKKKQNNFDCEAMLSFGDSLYLFTKRREDLQTELFVLPKALGNYEARSLGTFDSKGLVTDAAINQAGNEVALTGYQKGHRHPFILTFTNFSGNNFFSGKMQRIELADKEWDWQVEGISYGDDDKLYFACEQTKQVKATLYAVNRTKLLKLNKN